MIKFSRREIEKLVNYEMIALRMETRKSEYKISELGKQNIFVTIAAENSAEINAIDRALEKEFGHSSFKLTTKKMPTDFKAEPIGLEEIKKSALIRMRHCFPQSTFKEMNFAIGVQSGLISSAENNWHVIRICAITVFKQGSRFTYIDQTKPVQIQAIKNNDAYTELFDTALSILGRLNNIHAYDFNQPINKFHTVVTFGTFDLFHDLHKRLIDFASLIGDKIIIYIYDKDYKEKKNEKIPLKDSVQDRLKVVAEYALKNHKQVVIKRKKQKHALELQNAIKKYSAKGTLCVLGGEDQFEFSEVVDLCYRTQTPIISINRGETRFKLCSSDLREKHNYHRLIDIYDVPSENISVFFWKNHLRKVEDAKKYLQSLSCVGLEKTEIWKYTPNEIIDMQITQPWSLKGKIIICLPGRTLCSTDKVRRNLASIQKELIPAETKEASTSFMVCYEQNESTTETYINGLEHYPLDYFSDDAMVCFKMLIMPRISNQISIEKIENHWRVKKQNHFEKKPKDQILKNLSDVTFWARSRGSVLAIEIENAFRYCLRALGYNENEIIEAGKQIAVITICNLATLDRKRLFTTFSVSGTNDKQSNKYIKNFSDHLKNHHGDFHYTLHLMDFNHCVILTKNPENIVDDSTGLIVKEADQGAIHYTDFYLSYRRNGDNSVPRLIREAFQLALMRGINDNSDRSYSRQEITIINAAYQTLRDCDATLGDKKILKIISDYFGAIKIETQQGELNSKNNSMFSTLNFFGVRDIKHHFQYKEENGVASLLPLSKKLSAC